MFRKLARSESLGTFDVSREGQVRVAQQAGSKSHYLTDGARQLPVRDLLERVANIYAISDDPSNYFFEAIRANTVNPPNENNDAFHQLEMLRTDVRLGMPVYMTYAGKPHHLNHRTENPKAARGLIIDAHYNGDSPVLETCPACKRRTAERQNRDETGLHCKCGKLVRDEFVEILVGIDARKDPLFADGVRKGILRFGSMGCNCLSTTCNVCTHVAYSRPEFCEHIRAGNKGTLWTRKGSSWIKSGKDELAREMRRRKLAFDARDFCYAKSDDGFEARKAFEYCNQVVFDEYSSVDQPADPRAEQIEILNDSFLRAASVAVPDHIVPDEQTLRAETEAFIRSAEKKRLEREATMTRAAQRMRPPTQVPAPGPAPMTPDVGPGYIPPVDTLASPAPMTDQHGVGIQLEPGDEPLTINPPGSPAGPGGGPQPGGPGPTSIDQYTEQQMPAPDGQPPPGEEMEMGELGVLPIPPGASAPRRGQRSNKMPRKFDSAFGDWKVQISEQGNARLVTAERVPVLVFRAQKQAPTAEERTQFGLEVFAHLLDHGLVATAKKYTAHFSPRFAQVVEHAVDDMKQFSDKNMYSSVTEGGQSQHDMEGSPRGEPPASTRPNGVDDLAGDLRGKPPTSTGADPTFDHKKDDMGIDNVTQEGKSDMRNDPRKPKSVGKDDVLSGEVHDHVEPLRSKKGEADGFALGARLVQKVGGDSFVVTAATLLQSGGVEYTLNNGRGTQHKVAGDALALWKSLDQALPGTQRLAWDKRCDKCSSFKKADGSCKCAEGSDKSDEKKEAELNTRIAAADRKEKVANAKLAQAKKERDAAKVEAEALSKRSADAQIASFCRALRIVAARGAADLETMPLKQAAEAVLSEPRAIGTDAASGQPIMYRGLDPELTRYLVAHLYEVGHADHLEQLIKRARELMAKGDQYLIDAEGDVANFQPALPAITHSRVAEIDEDALHAEGLRRQAMRGNLNFNPAPSDGAPTNGGHDNKRVAIRGALGGTVVEAARGRLGLH